MTKRTIEFYRVVQYGTEREFVADPTDAEIVRRLTGQKTITVSVREMFRDLTHGFIQWSEILPPRKK